jgi:hypothetical protein
MRGRLFRDIPSDLDWKGALTTKGYDGTHNIINKMNFAERLRSMSNSSPVLSAKFSNDSLI